MHAFVNDLERPVGTHLYGRRMYETMAIWQTVGDEPGLPAAEADFAERVAGPGQGRVLPHARRRVGRPAPGSSAQFDPEAVRRLKAAADRDISISGPGLAQHAFRAGLVDEVHLFVFPVLVGGGKPGLPRDVHVDLELLDERRFRNGVVHMHHRAR